LTTRFSAYDVVVVVAKALVRNRDKDGGDLLLLGLVVRAWVEERKVAE
jgi:hypothetical protein